MREHRLLLVATDLDRTLLFSPRAVAALGGALPAAPVETLDGQVLSELAHEVADGLRRLAPQVTFVPATTRTVAQLRRIALPVSARFQVACSGGVVLEHGQPDPEWAVRTADRLAASAPLGEVEALLAAAAGRGEVLRHHSAEGLFCYAIVDPEVFADGPLQALVRACAPLGWRVAHQARKAYLLPDGLHKAHAVRYVAEQLAAETGQVPRVLAAGDTLLDLELLLAADAAWVPAGSELDRPGPRDILGGHVTFTAAPGHQGAAQILAGWLAAAADEPAPAGPGVGTEGLAR